MLDIQYDPSAGIRLNGRFDAEEVQRAERIFSDVKASCVVDFGGLDYISSAGLGVLLATQQRLSRAGHELKLVGMTPHVRMIFEYAGFDFVFDID